jgi:hypothetical protein
MSWLARLFYIFLPDGQWPMHSTPKFPAGNYAPRLLREHYDKVHKCIVESYYIARCCSSILFYKVSLLVVFIKNLKSTNFVLYFSHLSKLKTWSRRISFYISVICPNSKLALKYTRRGKLVNFKLALLYYYFTVCLYTSFSAMHIN